MITITDTASSTPATKPSLNSFCSMVYILEEKNVPEGTLNQNGKSSSELYGLPIHV